MQLAGYDFDISGVVNFLRPFQSAALQFPEGLLNLAAVLAEELEQKLPGIQLCLLTDVAYGACNADESLLLVMYIQALVHFGHSQLLGGRVPAYYVPCTRLDATPDAVSACVLSFCYYHHLRTIAVTATAYTRSFVPRLIESIYGQLEIATAKFAPLHDAEMLGCTAPSFKGVEAIFSLADGAFHAEALLVNNRETPVYVVDPRSGTIERLSDGVLAKVNARHYLVAQYKGYLQNGELHSVCLVLGTLGGQGSLRYLERLESIARRRIPHVFKMAVAEVHPGALNLPKCYLYVYLACPRLTLDWNEYFSNCLNACEFEQVLGSDIEDLLLNYAGNVSGSYGCHLDTWIVQK